MAIVLQLADRSLEALAEAALRRVDHAEAGEDGEDVVGVGARGGFVGDGDGYGCCLGAGVGFGGVGDGDDSGDPFLVLDFLAQFTGHGIGEPPLNCTRRQ